MQVMIIVGKGKGKSKGHWLAAAAAQAAAAAASVGPKRTLGCVLLSNSLLVYRLLYVLRSGSTPVALSRDERHHGHPVHPVRFIWGSRFGGRRPAAATVQSGPPARLQPGIVASPSEGQYQRKKQKTYKMQVMI